MAFTQEQQNEIDFRTALETARWQHELALDQKRAKLEAIRLAKETLIENARSKPIDSRDVSASDITEYASALVNYINS